MPGQSNKADFAVGPNVGIVSEEDYAADLKHASLFCRKNPPLLKILIGDMQRGLEFEKVIYIEIK